MKEAADAILRPEQAAYLEGIESPRDALLTEMESWARENRQPISDPEVAAFLDVVARSAQPKTIVEVGTNIGYGAIVLARASSQAKVFTIEYDPEMVRVARGYIDRAGLGGRIHVEQADALAALKAYEGPQIDLAYVDCMKEHYPLYLDLLLPKLAPRAVLVADNVLWKGLVAAGANVPAHEKERVEALRSFNQRIVSDSRLRGVILPLGDGLAYATRLDF